VPPWPEDSHAKCPSAAAGLQWWMLLQAQGFATYAWAVELRRLALAVAFMARFSPQVRPRSSVKMRTCLRSRYTGLRPQADLRICACPPEAV